MQLFIDPKWKRVEESRRKSQFWGALNVFRPRKTMIARNRKEQEWVLHFRGLLNRNDDKRAEGEEIREQKVDGGR